MSVSLYRNQVDRLTGEIAELERKVAVERQRAAKERGEALRKANSLSHSRSATLRDSKLRDIQRHEERAASHDKRGADYAKQIAAKLRSLTSASSSLQRTSRQQQTRDDQAAKRRRAVELEHLRSVERARRATPPVMSWMESSSDVQTREMQRDVSAAEFDVCLSFASEDRAYVEMVARELKARGLTVFYDVDETPKLWGKDLPEYLDYVYRVGSRYCVIFISAAYAKKKWTRLERRSALARALEQEDEYVLPARFDDTDLPGMPPTIAYVDLKKFAPETLARLVLAKLGRVTDDSVASEEDHEGLVTDDVGAILVPGPSLRHQLHAPHAVTQPPQEVFAQRAVIEIENVGARPAFIRGWKADATSVGPVKIRPPAAIPAAESRPVEVLISTLSASSTLASGELLRFMLEYDSGPSPTTELWVVVQYLAGGGWENVSYENRNADPR